MADIILDRETYIEFPDRPDIDMSKVTIEDNTLSLDEVLINSGLSFGECNANKFEVSLYGLPNVANEKIYVYQIVDDVEVPLFTGYVDSCKQDNMAYYRDLIAYDAMYYKGKLNIALWWENYWSVTNTANMHDLRVSLLDYMDMDYDEDQVLLNDDYTLAKPCRATTMSFADMLSQMCQVAMVNANMTRDGKLEFISLNPENSVKHNIINSYEVASSTFESYATQKITHLKLTNSADEVICTGGPLSITESNVYTISKNIFFYDLTAETGQPIVDAMYQEIKNISFNPANIVMICSDLDIKVGDYLRTDKHDDFGYVLVGENSLTGSLLVEQTVSFSANEYVNDTSTTYNAEIEALRKQTEEIAKHATSDLVISSYTNADILNITDKQEIFAIKFALTKKNPLIFLATIQLESTGDKYTEEYNVSIDGEQHELARENIHDTIAEITYTLDDTELAYKVINTYEDSKHNWVLYYVFESLEANKTYNFKGFMKTEYGKVRIGRNNLIASVMAVGLETQNIPWDGIIEIEEAIGAFDVDTHTITVDGINETVSASALGKSTSTLSESIGTFTVNGRTISVDGINTNLITGAIVTKATVTAADPDKFEFTDKIQVVPPSDTTSQYFAMRTEYTYLPTTEEFDDGKLMTLDIAFDELEIVEGVEVIFNE